MTNQPEKHTDVGEITILLRRMAAGQDSAAESLFERIYPDLRRIARSLMRGEPVGHTLQTTALVNEACMRLLGGARLEANDRVHLLSVAAKVMRHALVDYARNAGREKRGGHLVQATLPEVLPSPQENLRADLLDLDRALQKLGEMDARQAELVQLRFFGGLTVEEIGELLKLSQSTVFAELSMARAWLRLELSGG